MKALDRKLLRDLRAMWSQALTIALVVASGVGGFLTSLSAVDSLDAARDHFYAERHFADVFATVKRAPAALADQLRDVLGVADVQTTIEQIVRIQIPGNSDPVLGQLIGIDRLTAAAPEPDQRTERAQPVRRRRRCHQPQQDTIDALVSQGFAQARGLKAGDTLGALVNGRHRRLRDRRHRGVARVRVRRAVGHARPARLRRSSGSIRRCSPPPTTCRARSTRSRCSSRRRPRDARASRGDRRSRSSASRATAARRRVAASTRPRTRCSTTRSRSRRVLGTALPVIFLGVAAFLLNVVISRLVATQREQIAALKALGYTNHEHRRALPQAGAGDRRARPRAGHSRWATGWARSSSALYAESFHFAHFEHRLSADAGAARRRHHGRHRGAGHAVGDRGHRAPAAGRGDAAAGARAATAARWPNGSASRGLGPPLRMILRNMERRPLRTGLSIGGVAAAVAIVVMGNFFRDAIEVIVDSTFSLAMRSDVSVWLHRAGRRTPSRCSSPACPARSRTSRCAMSASRWSTATGASAR